MGRFEQLQARVKRNKTGLAINPEDFTPAEWSELRLGQGRQMFPSDGSPAFPDTPAWEDSERYLDTGKVMPGPSAASDERRERNRRRKVDADSGFLRKSNPLPGRDVTRGPSEDSIYTPEFRGLSGPDVRPGKNTQLLKRAGMRTGLNEESIRRQRRDELAGIERRNARTAQNRLIGGGRPAGEIIPPVENRRGTPNPLPNFQAPQGSRDSNIVQLENQRRDLPLFANRNRLAAEASQVLPTRPAGEAERLNALTDLSGGNQRQLDMQREALARDARPNNVIRTPASPNALPEEQMRIDAERAFRENLRRRENEQRGDADLIANRNVRAQETRNVLPTSPDNRRLTATDAAIAADRQDRLRTQALMADEPLNYRRNKEYRQRLLGGSGGGMPEGERQLMEAENQRKQKIDEAKARRVQELETQRQAELQRVIAEQAEQAKLAQNQEQAFGDDLRNQQRVAEIYRGQQERELPDQAADFQGRQAQRQREQEEQTAALQDQFNMMDTLEQGSLGPVVRRRGEGTFAPNPYFDNQGQARVDARGNPLPVATPAQQELGDTWDVPNAQDLQQSQQTFGNPNITAPNPAQTQGFSREEFLNQQQQQQQQQPEQDRPIGTANGLQQGGQAVGGFGGMLNTLGQTIGRFTGGDPISNALQKFGGTATAIGSTLNQFGKVGNAFKGTLGGTQEKPEGTIGTPLGLDPKEQAQAQNLLGGLGGKGGVTNINIDNSQTDNSEQQQIQPQQSGGLLGNEGAPEGNSGLSGLGNIMGTLSKGIGGITGGLNQVTGLVNAGATAWNTLKDIGGTIGGLFGVGPNSESAQAKMKQDIIDDQRRAMEDTQYGADTIYGTVRWEGSTANGDRKQVMKLDDYQQKKKDAASGLVDRLQDPDSYDKYTDEATQKALANWDTNNAERLQQQRNELEESLAARGAHPGSVAYNRAMKDLNMQQQQMRENAEYQAYQQGHQYGQDAYGNTMQAFQQFDAFKNPNDAYNANVGVNNINPNATMDAANFQQRQQAQEADIAMKQAEQARAYEEMQSKTREAEAERQMKQQQFAQEQERLREQQEQEMGYKYSAQNLQNRQFGTTESRLGKQQQMEHEHFGKTEERLGTAEENRQNEAALERQMKSQQFHTQEGRLLGEANARNQQAIDQLAEQRRAAEAREAQTAAQTEQQNRQYYAGLQQQEDALDIQHRNQMQQQQQSQQASRELEFDRKTAELERERESQRFKKEFSEQELGATHKLEMKKLKKQQKYAMEKEGFDAEKQLMLEKKKAKNERKLKELENKLALDPNNPENQKKKQDLQEAQRNIDLQIADEQGKWGKRIAWVGRQGDKLAKGAMPVIEKLGQGASYIAEGVGKGVAHAIKSYKNAPIEKEEHELKHKQAVQANKAYAQQVVNDEELAKEVQSRRIAEEREQALASQNKRKLDEQTAQAKIETEKAKSLAEKQATIGNIRGQILRVYNNMSPKMASEISNFALDHGMTANEAVDYYRTHHRDYFDYHKTKSWYHLGWKD